MRKALFTVVVVLGATLLVVGGQSVALADPSPPSLAVSLPEVYPGEMLHARWSHATATACEFDSDLDDAGPVTLGPDVDHHRFGPVTKPAPSSAFAQVTCAVPGGPGGGEQIATTVDVSVLPQPVFPEREVSTFDTSCLFRHSLMDDPIVFPRKPGASHLHDFLGTRGTNASSAAEELLLEGREDLAEDGAAGCKDKQDHAAYWAPALWRDGVKIDPTGSGRRKPWALHVYYRGDERTVSFPVGFGMVSKDAGWACGDRQAQSKMPINCFGTGRPVTMIVRFPHCWDGVHLTSTDKSHVSNANNCEDTDGPDPGAEPDFPVDLPRLTFAGLSYGNINHDNPPAQYEWKLGPNPDGSWNEATTAHADFFNAWEPFRLDKHVHQCIRQRTTGNPALTKLCHDDERP